MKSLSSVLLVALLVAFVPSKATALQPGQPGWDNSVLSFEDAKSAADAGDAYAQAVVSIYYSLGWKTEKNVELALKYAVSSAKAGHPLGIYRVGAAARAGDGAAKNEEQGLKLQANSIEGLSKMGGNPYAITSLGVMLFQGKVAQENKQEAARLYKVAADMGYAPAQFNYAMCAKAGNGMDKNPAIGDKYLQKAVNESYPLATSARVFTNNKEQIGAGNQPPAQEEQRNTSLNSETGVFEPDALKGESSKWHSLIQSSNQSDISVDFRTNYSDYNMPNRDDWQRYVFNQYRVTSEDEEGCNVALSVDTTEGAMRGKSIIEYPVALQFRIKNNGKTSKCVEALTLRVESVKEINDFLPSWVGDVNGFYLHNYGWSGDAPIRSHFILYAPINALKEDRLAKAQEFSIETSTSSDIKHPWPRFIDSVKGRLPFLDFKATLNLESGSSYSAYHSLDGGASGQELHVKIPARFSLPSKREGYKISFPVNSVVKPNESAFVSVTLDASQSINVKLRPFIILSNKETIAGRGVGMEYRSFRPLQSCESVIPLIGQDDSPLMFYQLSCLQSRMPIVTWNDCKAAKSLLQSTDKTLEDNDIKKLLISESDLFTKAVKTSEQTVELLPNTASKPSWAVCQTTNNHQSFDVTPSNATIKKRAFLTIKTDDRGICGVFSLFDSVSQSVVFQAPWSLITKNKGAISSTSLAMSSDQNFRWIAWLINAGTDVRLYVAFPGRSESLVSLPYAIESDIQRIGTSGDNLVLEYKTGTKMFNLNDPVISQLLDGAYAHGASEPAFSDIDNHGRYRLWIPPRKSTPPDTMPDWASPKECALSGATKVDLIDSLHWLSNSEIALKTSACWNVVNIYNATRRPIKQNQTALLKVNTSKAKPIEVSCGNGIFTTEYPIRNKLSIVVESSRKFKYDGVGIFKQNEGLNVGRGEVTFDGLHSRFTNDPSVSRIGAISENNKAFALSSFDGNKIFLISVEKLSIIGVVCFQDSNTPVGTIMTPDNFYLSGNGRADGISLTSGLSGVNLSQFEVQMNRPDIVLERLGAPPEMVKEAVRLRQRLVNRSDYKALGTVDLIDIPVVELTRQPAPTTEKREIKVEFKCSNNTGPLKEILIYNNGSLVEKKPLPGADGKPSPDSSGQATIALATGDNLIQLCAVSEEGVPSAFTPARVKCTAPPQSKNSFIVCVGLSEYQNKNFNLKYAAKDASDMSAALEKAARGRGLEPKVLLLRNQDVTAAIVDKIRAFLATATTDDEVTLFFAGHGLLDKDLGYQFATYTTDFTATENQGIPFEKLESLVEGIKPLKRTVLLDTCHSGEVEEEAKPELLAMVNGPSSPAPAEVAAVKKSTSVATRGMKISETAPKLRHSDFVQLESLFPDSRRAKGANILTSSSGSEFSMESDAWKNGLFTYTFLNALKDPKSDMNGDGNVTFEEISTTVAERVSALSGGSQRPITRGVNREVPSVLAINKAPTAQ